MRPSAIVGALALLFAFPLFAHASTVIFLTSGTSWTVPSNWNSSNNTIEVIGGGGGGGGNTSAYYAGGGGAYSKISNKSLTPGGSVAYSVGAGGASSVAGTPVAGGDTFFNRTAGSANTCADTSSVCAKGGGISTSPPALGGAAASGVGTIKYSGGAGYTGGGGAAGPNGAGVDGNSNPGSGGAGDNGFGGAGGGAAANGSAGAEFDASHGSGGGGGGASSGMTSGGLYGAGAGDGGTSLGSAAGAQGIIVITNTPLVAAAPTVTAISPRGWVNSASASITSVSGTAFVSGATVKLTKTAQSDISCTGFTFTNSTTLSSGTCPITSAAAGQWNVVVTNPDTQTGTFTNGFAITAFVSTTGRIIRLHGGIRFHGGTRLR